METENQRAEHIKHLDAVANWLDSKFKIPFTQNARFGLDSFIGFIPVVGDVTGFAVSALLIRTISKHGVSVTVFFRMIFNIIIDALVGSFPVLGDFFDIAHKANRKNVNLLRNYYEQNPNPSNAKWSFGLFGLLMLIIVVGLLWATWHFAGLIWAALAALWKMTIG
ncbi:MAG: hypothetical protein RL757_2078 [Bacteroidota bacterium]|jgi:hypothetical protein